MASGQAHLKEVFVEKQPAQQPVKRVSIFGPAGRIITGIIDNLVASMKNTSKPVSLGGAGHGRSLYFPSAGINSGHFKPNQRKERARSRRRKMKPSAR